MVSPSISIIVPVYNAESCLSRCLESILNQAFTDYEILLIDDGSKDESSQICEEYAMSDSRIRVYHKSNGGVSSARNLGLSLAQGNWIVFIDSDDEIDSMFLSLSITRQADLVLTNWSYADGTRCKDSIPSGYFDGDSLTSILSLNAHRFIFRVVWGKFLVRSIIAEHKISFDERVTVGEDTLFMMSYLSHVKTLLVDNEKSYIYYRPDQWGLNKYSLDFNKLRYFLRQFYNSYKINTFCSPLLVKSILDFFPSRAVGDTNQWVSLILIKSMPEYLACKCLTRSSWSRFFPILLPFLFLGALCWVHVDLVRRVSQTVLHFSKK